MKSHQKEKKTSNVNLHTPKQGCGSSSHNLKHSKGEKTPKQVDHTIIDSTKKSEPSSNTKPSQHRKFKKKPWQKYNARATAVQGTEGEGSSDSDSDGDKYKKREIVDNALRFEDPEEDEHLLKEMKKEEEKDFSELCEKMQIREKVSDLSESSQGKGKIPNSVVLPKDFEKDLDLLLTTNVSQQRSNTDAEYDDSESFSKWLQQC